MTILDDACGDDDLNTITLPGVRNFLQSAGWEHRATTDDRAQLWRKGTPFNPRTSVWLPLYHHGPGSHELLVTAVHRIAAAEGLSVLDVAVRSRARTLAPPYDVRHINRAYNQTWETR